MARRFIWKRTGSVTLDVTATHVTVKEMTRRVEGRGHKLYIDNFFSCPYLFDELTKKKVNCCQILRPNRKGMPQDPGYKSLKLEKGDKQERTRDDLTSAVS
jgi:hypothetical protein